MSDVSQHFFGSWLLSPAVVPVRRPEYAVIPSDTDLPDQRTEFPLNSLVYSLILLLG